MALLPMTSPRLTLGIGAHRLWLETAPRAWPFGRPAGERVRREQAIPSGLVQPSATALNISDVEGLAGALRTLVGRRRLRWWATPVALSLPDPCARVVLLDFEAWPRQASDAETLLSWRLQKDLNVPAAETLVAHRVFPLKPQAGSRAKSGPDGPVNVLAIAIKRAILEQYEQVCAQAGLLPVAISVDSLRCFDLSRPTMGGNDHATDGAWFFFHVADDSLAFIAGRGAKPVFIRCKPLRNGDRRAPAGLAAEMLATLQFHDERVAASSPSPEERCRPFFLSSRLPPVSEELVETFASLRARIVTLPSPLPVAPRRGSHCATAPALPRLNVLMASRRLTAARATQWALVLLIVVSIGWAIWAWRNSRGLGEQAARYARAAERVQAANHQFAQRARQAGVTLTEARAKALGREVAFANRLIEQQAFSWTTFLSHLEDTVPPQISISSVGLNFKDASITLNGIAVTLKDLTAFVNDLEQHAAFQNVVLAHHRLRASVHDGVPAHSQTEPTALTLPLKPAPERGSRETVEFTMTVTYLPPS